MNRAPDTRSPVWIAIEWLACLALAGVLTIGGSAGVGAGVDVEVITKTTEAWIAKGTSTMQAAK